MAALAQMGGLLVLYQWDEPGRVLGPLGHAVEGEVCACPGSSHRVTESSETCVYASGEEKSLDGDHCRHSNKTPDPVLIRAQLCPKHFTHTSHLFLTTTV